jgi:hypothetical protein
MAAWAQAVSPFSVRPLHDALERWAASNEHTDRPKKGHPSSVELN